MDSCINVFIVEDSAILRERLDRTISDIPHVTIVGSADNASGAIEQLTDTQPDVIILDIHLRQSSGFQVLQQVKSHTHSPCVIVLTNYSYPQYRAKYMQAGADYFFDKSVEMDQMVQVIKTLAAQGPDAPQRKDLGARL